MTVSMTDHSPRIEVITSVQRRRRWSGPEKMRMVEETFEPGAAVSLVARRHGVVPNQLFTSIPKRTNTRSCGGHWLRCL
jgi:transposase